LLIIIHSTHLLKIFSMKNQKKIGKEHNPKISQRDFIGSAATTAAAFTIVPRHALGGSGNVSPSDKLNIACIGVGGQGANDIFNLSSENIVALCDVDDTRGLESFGRDNPGAYVRP
jgi:hypothetical protein